MAKDKVGRSGADAPSGHSPKGEAKPSVPNAVADKLREAKALIERGWTQGVSMRDAKGAVCLPPEAVCWCAYGAMTATDAPIPAYDILDEVMDGEMVTFNDKRGRTQAEVLAAFDKAIELAEANNG